MPSRRGGRAPPAPTEGPLGEAPGADAPSSLCPAGELSGRDPSSPALTSFPPPGETQPPSPNPAPALPPQGWASTPPPRPPSAAVRDPSPGPRPAWKPRSVGSAGVGGGKAGEADRKGQAGRGVGQGKSTGADTPGPPTACSVAPGSPEAPCGPHTHLSRCSGSRWPGTRR